jgi:hypothetical protein
MPFLFSYWHGSEFVDAVESSSVLIRTTTTSMTEIVHVEETRCSEMVPHLETDLDGYVVAVTQLSSLSLGTYFFRNLLLHCK